MWSWLKSWWYPEFPLLESKEKIEERKQINEEAKRIQSGRYTWSPTKIIEMYGTPPIIKLDPIESTDPITEV